MAERWIETDEAEAGLERAPGNERVVIGWPARWRQSRAGAGSERARHFRRACRAKAPTRARLIAWLLSSSPVPDWLTPNHCAWSRLACGSRRCGMVACTGCGRSILRTTR